MTIWPHAQENLDEHTSITPPQYLVILSFLCVACRFPRWVFLFPDSMHIFLEDGNVIQQKIGNNYVVTFFMFRWYAALICPENMNPFPGNLPSPFGSRHFSIKCGGSTSSRNNCRKNTMVSSRPLCLLALGTGYRPRYIFKARKYLHSSHQNFL